MNEIKLTNEERRSLKLWFRQAIAQIEAQEVSSELIRRHKLTAHHLNHHTPIKTRRAPRHHHKDLVAN